MEKETFNMNFKCHNCFHVWQQEFKKGTELKRGIVGGIWAIEGNLISSASRKLECLNCGFSDEVYKVDKNGT